jgi:hypothetical protein
MIDPAQLLETSPLAGARLALRVFAAGAAWLWLWPEALAAPAERWRRMVCAGGLAAATGLVGLLLSLTLLSSWGLMAPWTFNAVSLAVPVTGIIFALVFRSPELLPRARAALPAAAAAMALFSIALLLPASGRKPDGRAGPRAVSGAGPAVAGHERTGIARAAADAPHGGGAGGVPESRTGLPGAAAGWCRCAETRSPGRATSSR